MRQFPRVTLILLLFLIAALLGSLVWLQWSTHLEQQGDDRSARAGTRGQDGPGPDANGQTPEPAKEPKATRDIPAGRSTQPDSTDTVDVDATTTPEPRRTPPDHELKPDLEQIARDDAKAVAEAKRLAELEATFSRGAVAEESRDGLNLHVRVVWAVPPLSALGRVTGSHFSAHYCGPLEKHPQAAKEAARRLGKASVSAKEARELFGEEWVLVGKVSLAEKAENQPDAWAGLDKPPIIVRGLNGVAVANAQGWFALTFLKRDWIKEAAYVEADFPGYEVIDENGRSVPVSLASSPESQGAVTVALSPVPMLAVKVDYKPAQATQSGLRAWLEVRRARPDGSQGIQNHVGLFLESDVPNAGQLTFMLPDPRTWTGTGAGGASIRIGAGGDGWASGTPMIITNWDTKDGREVAIRKGAKYLAIKTSLTMDRASSDLVVGRFRVVKAESPGSPVRVESSHTGAVTWSERDGSFKLWTQLDRGNWKQKLIIQPTYAPAFSFFIDYDSQRPPNVELRKGGSAPLGPWDVTLPPRTGSLMYLSVPRTPRGLDLHLETTEGWTPLLLDTIATGSRLVLCSNWPDWYDEVVIVDREKGRVQRARLEPYQTSDADFPYGGRVTDSTGEPIKAMKIIPIED
ncbi:MAG: hypothetical protein IPP14_12285 [Planctomycetes bacterium]|nr:hypothetical protein [Planctomycetota bacterium]